MHTHDERDAQGIRPASRRRPHLHVVDEGTLLRAAGRRGRRALHDRHTATQRHRLSAHGSRAQQHHPGCRHQAAAHDGSSDPLGRRAPITPASPRRTRSSRSSPRRACRATTSAARSSSSCAGRGGSEHGSIIIEQLKRMGCSCDYSDEWFTMDPSYQRAVRKVFVDWFDKGLIYRGKRIINWCPRCSTALSDIEVEHEDLDSHLWHLRYPLKEPVGGLDHLVVATTRPGDDARRHVRRGAPGRRALRRRGGRDRRPAAAGQGDPGRRRRVRRPELRHRRGQGHARARPERLRDRRAPRLCPRSTS